MKTVFRWPATLLQMLIGMLCTSVQAEPTVQCRLSSSGEMREAVFTPISDPLSTTAIDLGNGFRFSAVLLEPLPAPQRDSPLKSPLKFKTYVYYESKDRHVLIARQENLLDSRECNTALGMNEVYSPYLENNLTFECTTACSNQPPN